MATSTIFIPTPLRKFTDGNSSVEVSGVNVGEAITQLADAYPDLRRHLLDDNNAIRRFMRIYIGEDDINQLEGPNTAIKPGDKISIIPAIAGGLS